MGATQTRLSGEQLLLQAYRDSFKQYKLEANRLAAVKNTTEAEKALLRVEDARVAYNDSRDSLAASLMSAEVRRAFWALPGSFRQDHRVRNIAELLWELAGKPQGSADDDWYRAERVVRHSRTEAFCAH